MKTVGGIADLPRLHRGTAVQMVTQTCESQMPCLARTGVATMHATRCDQACMLLPCKGISCCAEAGAAQYNSMVTLQELSTGPCRFLSYGRQGRWSQAYAAANGRFTHFVLGNEVGSSLHHQWSTQACVQIQGSGY